ncbi:MAG: DNA polymerase III subunit beta [SAR86 cluster bacterium]|uniref:Beta sliding clamp n=1 Tax=SAR86 cluster bacterium TaxID=2030880 RepID=A0A2A5CJ45_9GAMM|nr:DNA polymerase III subunit beta [Gammaproteobacteria bacterium AH-315-E17]PCJ43548.1 MAG: DNA polymerase III subunit beta [SAR86 cluster bacterium]
MQFEISRETLIKPLQLVTGVVERRQTLPVLSNVLLVLEGNQLSMTGTDLEVELIGRVEIENSSQAGEVTVPARKLMDICKSLPDSATLKMELDDNKLIIRSGRSRFTLSTLPSSDFPSAEESSEALEFSISQERLKEMLDSTSFAMAQQDVRYYLNGLLFEVSPNFLRVVATDGHRLAMDTEDMSISTDKSMQVIVPRKGILELARLLGEGEDNVDIAIGSNHIRAKTANFTFTSKLVDGKFPDYDRVLPKGGDKTIIADRNELRQSLSRTAILSNEKFRGIRLTLLDDEIKILANNPEQEEAEEIVAVEYKGDSLEIGFNVSYLIDVLTVLNTETVQIIVSDPNSSALIQGAGSSSALYVVMPMRL